MTAVVAYWLECWWARLFGRRTAAEPLSPVEVGTSTPVAAVIRAPLSPAPAAERDRDNPPPNPAVKAARADAQREAEQSLLQILRVNAMPSAPTFTLTVDTQARERTLEALQGLRQIPALQSLARGFTRVLSRPEVAVGEVVEAIEKDSALCVRILRMANSVLVSPERRIEDLETAVQMLGVARVRNAAQALFTLRDGNRVTEGFDWRQLWMHALATAAIAEELEQRLRSVGDSQIYMAALLHDVGKIVLSTIDADVYREVLITAWNDVGRLEDLERARLGVDHREAGVMFAQFNELPAAVIAAIQHHNRPENAEKHRLEVALVSIANYASKAYGLGFGGARLDPNDGDFAELPAWKVVEQELGWRPNTVEIEEDLGRFVISVREDLWALRESA